MFSCVSALHQIGKGGKGFGIGWFLQFGDHLALHKSLCLLETGETVQLVDRLLVGDPVAVEEFRNEPELVAQGNGIGAKIIHLRNDYDYTNQLALILIIGFIGMSLNYVLSKLERQYIQWKE